MYMMSFVYIKFWKHLLCVKRVLINVLRRCVVMLYLKLLQFKTRANLKVVPLWDKAFVALRRSCINYRVET